MYGAQRRYASNQRLRLAIDQSYGHRRVAQKDEDNVQSGLNVYCCPPFKRLRVYVQKIFNGTQNELKLKPHNSEPTHTSIRRNNII